MINQPVKEGPPNRTAMIASALAEIDDQYAGIRDVLVNLFTVLQDIDKRLSRIEKRLK